MKTTGVFTLTTTPVPLRGYVRYSAESAFPDPYKENAKKHLQEVVEQHHAQKRFKSISFAVGIVWGRTSGETHEPAIDLFGYEIDLKSNWRTQNPTVYAWTMHNGIYQLSPKIACEDGLIILGKEAEYRRSTVSLDAYMRELPPFAKNLAI